jgi:uncharacterized protein YciI
MTLNCATPLLPALAVMAAMLSPQSPYPAPANFETVYVALLLRGPAAGQGTPAELEARQKAHLAHLEALGNAGHAKIAGPVGGDGDLRGIVLITAASLDEARRMAGADPAVKAGAVRVEVLTMTAPANWFTLRPVPADYTMRQHVLAFLDAPPASPALAPDEAARLQDGHLANLFALREQGRLAYAGPITDGGSRRGLAVFLSESVEEVREWMADDPFVRAGRLTLELYPWWAADGILTPVR